MRRDFMEPPGGTFSSFSDPISNTSFYRNPPSLENLEERIAKVQHAQSDPSLEYCVIRKCNRGPFLA